MGARANPMITRGAHREIAETISVRVDASAHEIDPRLVFVDFGPQVVLISVPLRNVGRGLAVIVEADIAAEGDALYDMKSPPSASRVRVPVGETTRVNIVARRHSPITVGPGDRWAITVPYTDFAGRQRAVANVVLECRRDSPARHQWHTASVEHAE